MAKQTNYHFYTSVKKEIGGLLTQIIVFLRPPNKKAGEKEYVKVVHTIEHKPFNLSEKAWKEKHKIKHIGKAYPAINKDGTHNSQMHQAPSKVARLKQKAEQQLKSA